MNFINHHDILYEYQFGFRERHSTNLALSYLVDNITNAYEKGDAVLGVFIDFSKAFNTINHTILLQKLQEYGIRGISLKWFESYLSNRQQYVSYKGVESNFCNKIV